MEVAERVARRYQADPRLHRLCPIVVPVNGLLGHAAATLREDEYAALAALARAPADDGRRAAADGRPVRDAATSSPVPVERSGRGCSTGSGSSAYACPSSWCAPARSSTSSELSARLADVSGLDRLREVVLRQFDARARVLKARSAVAALREIFLRGDCADGPALLRRLEQITAGAHEFEEVRILLELRDGELSLTPEQAAELDLLMGGSGPRPAVAARAGRGRRVRASVQAGGARGAGPVAGRREAPACPAGAHPDRGAGRDPHPRGPARD